MFRSITRRNAARIARQVERDRAIGDIINAIGLLELQRLVALKAFGKDDPHLGEIDDERDALLDRARDLGAVWA